MQRKLIREQLFLEIALSIVCVSLVWMLYLMRGHKMVVLNLFFPPIVLAGFFLGRYRAGVMALLSVLCASVVAVIAMDEFLEPASPTVIALVLAVWGAVLGLSAILVGTLSDDRTSKIDELHEAYVGVVEVLAQYLHSANPQLRAQSIRVAELGREVATELSLSPRQIDDICVAALLYDVGNIEVTTRVIRKAVDNFDDDRSGGQSTFHGMDLMLSLGSVLRGAIPLLLTPSFTNDEAEKPHDAAPGAELPIGAKILWAVRDYLSLTQSQGLTPPRAVAELRQDHSGGFDPQVLGALERVVARKHKSPSAPPMPVLPSIPAPLPDQLAT